jgi:hypothetical protein
MSVSKGKVVENHLFKKPDPKKGQIYLLGDLVQNQVVNIMAPEWLGPQ